MLLIIKVFPLARKVEVIEKENYFEVKVRSKPERGEANRELIKILSDHFCVPEGKIKIIKGLKSRNKIIEVKD